MSDELKPKTKRDVTAEPAEELPAGWRGGRRGDRRAQYAYGSHIELEIEPRYHTKRAQLRRQPSQFRVQLRKRFYAHELVGRGTLLGTTGTFEEAVELAHAYMAEFVADRQRVAMEVREEVEADPVLGHEAEEAIVTEAATEAAVDVAGYSDDLLVSEIKGLLESKGDMDGTKLYALVHREDTSYDIVHVADEYSDWAETNHLREFYRQFDWLNEQKLATSIDVGELTIMTATFEEVRMVRYLASEDEETVILIDPSLPLHLPPFERQIADIVGAKWHPPANSGH